MATQAYFLTDGVEGDFYDCLDNAAAGQSPATHPAKWRRVEIPALFEPFLVSRATSLLLVGEGQSDKARAEERASVALLEELIYRDRRERGRLGRPRVYSR